MLATFLLFACALAFLLLLVRALSVPLPPPTAEAERARRLGATGGLLGGDIEDTMVARHGLDRSGTDPAARTPRDEVTAIQTSRTLDG